MLRRSVEAKFDRSPSAPQAPLASVDAPSTEAPAADVVDGPPSSQAASDDFNPFSSPPSSPPSSPVSESVAFSVRRLERAAVRAASCGAGFADEHAAVADRWLTARLARGASLG